uniref:Integrase catalytic domain-containing protein n=1 Tax=Amphimedon queenslandica TaxID=400682 RepID=A0A1X7SFK5_AMPQE
MTPKDKCTSKVWICLYTCCLTRVVHIDIVPNLSAYTFMRCFRRFIARRGMPRPMISDNGKTFKAAAKIIKELMSQDYIQQHLTSLGIDWRFNLERASWWGEIFERLIHSMKRCLKKIIGKSQLSYEELLTAVSEAEMIINSCPLSYISMDDLEEPVTPSHMMIGRRLLSLPDVS